MANVVFLSLYDRNAYGLRVMCANLKRHGHRCHMIFLKRYDTNPTYKLELEVGEYPWMGVGKNGRVFKYASNSQISEHELEILGGLISDLDPDVIGMTVNTPLRSQNIKTTRFLKDRFDVPVIWGGYDPTVNAPDCLELCDYACVGEGDQTILDVAKRIDEGSRDFKDVCNLAYRSDGEHVYNTKAIAEQNLDNYPWRDDTPEDKYFIEDDQLVANYDRPNDRAEGHYQAMSARGCPYKCSYCCEATFKGLYSGEKFLRRRSPKDIVAELAHAKSQFNLTKIQFEDEIFAMNVKWLREFVPLYKEQVDLPFTAYIYPTRNIEAILMLLKSAGLNYACLALESGSEHINKKVFDRVYDRETFLETARVCKELGIPYYTDVITYNPYEEEEDLRQTLDVLHEMRGGFSMCINKLFVLPGTKMAEDMKRDGITVGDGSRDSLFNYYCRLYWITSFTRHSKLVVGIIERMRIFRRYPWLLNPTITEALINPIGFVRSQAKNHLPRRLVKKLQTRISRRHAPAAAKANANLGTKVEQPVCR
ncbi:MAG: hypothetical protein CMJ83_09370 [Planctomycetes bacterium]|nr:hypothetical protein [Planctomycetota bacterium]